MMKIKYGKLKNKMNNFKYRERKNIKMRANQSILEQKIFLM